MEFFNYKNKLKPTRGRVLVSEPYLNDPNFERTIILLCEHNEEGSFGFVLNKPSLVKVNDVIENDFGFDSQIFVGGPVQQDTLHFVHRCPTLEDAVEIGNGIYWGGNFESLTVLMETKQVDVIDVKFFLGYSGWSETQLDEELNADSWIVSDGLNAELVFETNSDVMWQKVLKDMGGRFSVYSNYPLDPRLN